jgi:hypothetical protein
VEGEELATSQRQTARLLYMRPSTISLATNWQAWAAVGFGIGDLAPYCAVLAYFRVATGLGAQRILAPVGRAGFQARYGSIPVFARDLYALIEPVV